MGRASSTNDRGTMQRGVSTLGIAGAVGALALLGLLLVLGTGYDDAVWKHPTSGVWLANDTTFKLTHVAESTGEPDARIALSTPEGERRLEAIDEVVRSEDQTYLVDRPRCQIHWVDEARLDLGKRRPRRSLVEHAGDTPCAEVLVAAGPEVVVLGHGSAVERLDPRTLETVGEPLDVGIAELQDLGVTASGRIVIGGTEGELVEVDDGQIVRRDDLGDEPVEVAVVADRAVAAGDDELVMAEPGGTDRRITWDRPEGAAPLADQPGPVLAVTDVESVVALDLASGEERGRWPTDEVGDPAGAPVAVGEAVYVAVEGERAISRLTDAGVERLSVDVDDEGESAVDEETAESEDDDATDEDADAASTDLEVFALHGRLWAHLLADRQGMTCDATGACEWFDKSTPAVQETEATDPEEPDPPQVVDDGTDARPEPEPEPDDEGDDDEAAVTTTVPPPAPAAPPTAGPPGPVGGLTAQPGDRRITTTWTAAPSELQPVEYRVEVRGPGGGTTTVTDVEADGTYRHESTGLSNGQGYDVTVTALAQGLEGPPTTRADVVPSDRIPRDVAASAERGATCRALGRPSDCADGDAGGVVAVTWTPAPNVDSYDVGCDTPGGPSVKAGVAHRSEGVAVDGLPPDIDVTCWVQSGPGRRTQAPPVRAVGLPDVSLSVESNQFQAAAVRAALSGPGVDAGTTQLSATVGSASAPIGADGRVSLADQPVGTHPVAVTASNVRGSRTRTIDATVVPGAPGTPTFGPGDAWTEAAPCCSLQVSWSPAPGAGSYTLTATGAPNACSGGCPVGGTSHTIGMGSHAELWQPGVDPFAQQASITVTVTADGGGGSSQAVGQVSPFTVTPSNPGYKIFENMDQTGWNTPLPGNTAVRVLCVGSTNFYAVEVGSTTGWIAPGAATPPDGTIPAC